MSETVYIETSVIGGSPGFVVVIVYLDTILSHKKGAQAFIMRMYKFYLSPKPQETLIGYLTARSTKNLIIASNIETTRDWWQNRRNDFVLYISQVVLDEVAKGDIEIALKRL